MKKDFYNNYIFLLFVLLTAILGSSGCAVLAPLTAATAGMVAFDERSAGSVVDDTVIVSKVKKEFAADGDINKILTKVSVTSYEGRVLLSGTVKEEMYKEEATKAAWSVHGVKEVINVLEIAPSPKNKANDGWIGTQINAKFLAEKKFDSMNYKVDVNDGVVYMIGVAQNQEELDRAVAIASKVKGVEKVVNYVLLKDDKRRG